MATSIIIPTSDRSILLRKALTSVARRIKKTTIKCEIIVVENGATDDTRAIVENLIKQFAPAPIRYVYEPIPGLLSGRHRGALEAKGEVLVFIDDDVEVGEHWLAAVAEAFSDTTVQLCGGKSLPLYEGPPPDWIENLWFQPPYGGQACVELSLLDMGERPLDVDATYIWGLNFAIRKKALFDLGGFHPDLLPERLQHLQGDGETGLSQKANAAGYRAVYQPAAAVQHHVPVSRMTAHYLQKRYFYQGVCDSYTHIRATGRALCSQIHQTPHSETSLTATDQIRLKCTVAHQDGFRFHQRAVAYSRELLEWVLRPDYWDYRLPNVWLPEHLRRPDKP